MKRKLFCLATWAMAMTAANLGAQTFTTLHGFTGGSDGANPWSGLILSGNTLYGTAYHGGISGVGAVFAVNTDGTGFTTLYSFTGSDDGANPSADLILSGNTLYGTAVNGGSSGDGTIIAINTDGTGFSSLHDFTEVNSDGGIPLAPLMLSGNMLYGTAQDGGLHGVGTLFALDTNGTGYTTLYNFGGPANAAVAPHCGLILSGNTLYGTTIYGGSSGNGTVFAVNTDGSGFTNLHSFTGGSDGEAPYAGLILSGNTLYGTAVAGASSGNGTVFAVNTDGTGFTNLHSFTGGSDGSGPFGALILSGNALYGTAQGGGSAGHGTVFAVNTDGTGFTNLYSFSGGEDGAQPATDLILSGNTLYGTTVYGGSAGDGTLFSLTLSEFNYTTNNGTITITGYVGPMANALIIPSAMNGLPVTSIGDDAFEGDTKLTSVSIPNSVTSIGDYAFEDCANLTEVCFQGNAPSVGVSVFAGDTNATVYYLAGTLGWGPTLGGLPAAVGHPPLITSQPAGQTAVAGSHVTLEVAVAGTGPFTYQWQLNGVNVPNDADSSTLSLGGVSAANVGGYQVIIAGPYGGVTSAVATVTVLFPPTIVTEPQSQAVAIGSDATLSVAATGTTPLDYQWYFDGAPIQGQTNTTLLLTGAVLANAGSYNVVVTNLYGSLTSAVAVVSVGIPPRITDQSGSQVNPLNSTAAFSVAVSGTGPFTYQWQFDGTNFPGGVITTVAGGGTNGVGDGGVATNAELYYPQGVGVDAFGNLFIADTDNQRVRELGTDGVITTVAGNGTSGYSGDGGTATGAELNNPTSVAVDASGNLFIADTANNVIREVGDNGIITTVAGNGTIGYSGDGGAATNAELASPGGVAVDAFGNLFIADTANSLIRKVGSNGIISTVAGNYPLGGGYSGDGSVATNAQLNSPSSIAVDASGNLFIADDGNSVVRKVGTNGIITTVAGNSSVGAGYSGDGGAATNAALDGPTGVAVDASGNLFIADSSNSRIREVGSDGVISTVAGNGMGGYSGDGGAATNAELDPPVYVYRWWYGYWYSPPMGVAVDAAGNVFIADNGNNRIRTVVFPGPTLLLNNVSGANAGEYDVVASSPYGSVTSSVVSLVVLMPPSINTQPQSQGVAIGSNATLSVAVTGTPPLDYQWYFDGAPVQAETNTTLLLSAAAFTNAGSYNVVVTNLYGSVTSSVAVVTVGLPPGITTQPVSETNLLSSAATFSVAVSGTGAFTYQWQFNGTNLPIGIITTVAGNGFGAGTGYGGYSGDGGAATNAELNGPTGVAVDASGNLFIADRLNGRIREVATNGIITTVAGGGTKGLGDGGAATNAQLNAPSGVAVDASGNLFIADTSNQRIRKVGTNGIITTVAGDGTAGYSGDDGVATHAELSGPGGVAVDASGNLFIADTFNQGIRKVGTNGIITTVAGNGYTTIIEPNGYVYGGFSGDGGSATNAELNYPSGVALDASGNLFIADTYNQRIREVGTDGVITTVAGNGYTTIIEPGPYVYGGFSGDGGAATNAELNDPTGVAVDASGNLFIADEGNNAIRQVGTNGIITTVAGNGTDGYSGDGGPATNAELYVPESVAVDASAYLFIADSGNSLIRKVVLPGPRLVLINVGGANAGTYDVVVTSPYGSVTSSVVTLVVALNPLNALSIGGQEVQLQFQGVPGNSYVLLSATNLTPPVDWRPIITNVADTNGNWAFTVSNVLSENAVFYRYRTSNPGQ